LRGCDPKKMLRCGAKIVDAVDLMRGKGIEADALRINWPELMAFKRTFTDKMPGRVEAGLVKNGITTFPICTGRTATDRLSSSPQNVRSDSAG